MGRRSFIDFGRDLRKVAKGIFAPTPFAEALEKIKPEKLTPTINTHRERSGILPVRATSPKVQVTTGQWPKAGNKMVVIQDDEGLVKQTVVDRMTAVQAEIDWWQLRLLWSADHMPDFEKTRRYIEGIEAELKDLRLNRNLGDLDDLT